MYNGRAPLLEPIKVLLYRGDLIIQSGNSGFFVINLIEINLGLELVAVIE